MLGGFHFNDRRYADDDLTLGSIDPYQIFRIFHEIHHERDERSLAQIAFMIDQSHNLKGKMEAMVQTVVPAQELWLKAALVDRDKLDRSCRTNANWWRRKSCSAGLSGPMCGPWWRRGAKGAACLPIRWRRCARAATWSAQGASAAAGRRP